MRYAGPHLPEGPLEGRLTRLLLITPAEAGLMAIGRRLPWWAEGYPRRDDVDAAAMVQERWAPGTAGWGPRHVVRRSDGLAVGSLGFFGPPDAHGVVEVGYGLVESARRQGLISDALAVAVAAAEAARATVQAHTAYGNQASRRALERAGFTTTGVRDEKDEVRYTRAGPAVASEVQPLAGQPGTRDARRDLLEGDVAGEVRGTVPGLVVDAEG